MKAKAGGALSWGLTEPPMASQNQTFSCLRMGRGGGGGGSSGPHFRPLSCSHPTLSNGYFSGGGGVGTQPIHVLTVLMSGKWRRPTKGLF